MAKPDTAKSRAAKPPTPKAKGGKLRPNWRRQAFLAGLAVMGIGFGYGIGFWLNATDDPAIRQAPAEAPRPAPAADASAKPWYQTQAPPPALIKAPDPPLFPDHPGGQAGEPVRPYEEPLPREVYVPAPSPRPAAVATTPSRVAPPAPSPGRPVPVVPPAIQPYKTAPAPAATASPTETAQLPIVPKAWTGAEPPPWRRFAVAAGATDGRARIAIVIDDMGIDRKHSAEAIRLPAPLTLSFLTYAQELDAEGAKAHAAGHELMLHVAMEPQNITLDPGPNVLMVEVSEAENLRRLTWGLDRFKGYVGINNHMGSKFTRDLRGMTVVMGEMKRRGLLFLDSRTAGGTVGAELARRFGVPFAERNIFLDNVNEPAYVRDRLAELEALAKKRGFAIAIGHPKEATVKALADWLPGLQAKGLQLVPLSALVTHPAGSG